MVEKLSFEMADGFVAEEFHLTRTQDRARDLARGDPLDRADAILHRK